MSDEDSKFSFSDRTRVDEGDADSGSPMKTEAMDALPEGCEPSDLDLVSDAGADEEHDDDAGDKTGIISAEELTAAGILETADPDPDPSPGTAEPASDVPDASDSQAFGARTMMLDSSSAEDEEPPAVPPAPQEPPPLPFELQLLAGEFAEDQITVQGHHLVVGRFRECDIVLHDSSVSRRHFELKWSDPGYTLYDLGSGNGTLVDGKSVTEIALAHGMTIEAGMTRLMWCDPRLPPIERASPTPEKAEEEEAKTQVLDVRALQADLALAAKTRGAPAPSPAPPPREARAKTSPGRSSSSVSKTARTTRPTTSALLARAAMVMVVVLALVGIISLVNMVWGTDGEEKVAAQTSVTAEPQALMSQGLEAFKGWNWSEARRLFEAAREGHPDPAAVASALERVAQEEEAASVMEAVRTAIETHRYRDAIGKLGEVPDSSVYYGDAKALIKEATEGLVTGHLKEARALSAAGKTGEAIVELEQALQLLPGDAETEALLGELRDAPADAPKVARKTTRPAKGRSSRSTAKPPTRRTTKRVASDFELEPDWPDDTPGGEKKEAGGGRSLDVGPGLAKYGAGNFAEAIKLLERVKRNTDDDKQRDKAQRLVGDIRAFKTL